MERALTLHPDSRSAAVDGIAVEAVRAAGGSLGLRYAVRGRVEGVRWPPLGAPERADGLWRRTCFEAFVRVPGSSVYFEFNFAPSTEWAAYRFSGYREGAADIAEDELEAPQIVAGRGEDGFSLRAGLTLTGVPELAGDAAWELALSAVIEEADGSISHWALAHPAGVHDFHHADGFALSLPVPELAGIS